MLLDCDVAIVGGGFGGSLTALLLLRLGLRPVLIERGRHPRFALGESSTPQADLILERLATLYDLPRVKPLAAWGPWQAAYPELPCGLKRGFSYFQHQSGRPFARHADHRTELLVGASAGDDDSDTHWHRATFDEFLFDEARNSGVDCFEETEVTGLEHADGWQLTARNASGEFRIGAKFLIDASGDGQFLARRLGLGSCAGELLTRSRCVFAHFEGVREWAQVLEESSGAGSDDYPFPMDAAALHHIFPGGWMYVLRFNTGVTSAGFSLDLDRFPVPEGVSPAAEFQSILDTFPSIAEQFAQAKVVAPAPGIVRTGRLQRLASQAAGPDWAMVPTTAGILDALHSTGNAHTLSGIERLTEIFADHWKRPTFVTALAEYSRAVDVEVRLLDQIVSGCYAAFGRFELLIPFAMFYFAGATFAEHRRRQNDPQARRAFLCADLPEFRGAVSRGRELLMETLSDDAPDAGKRFEARVREILAPFNVAGLCDPARNNMYPYTGY